MANVVTLKVVTTGDFNAATTGFKSLATEAKAAGGPLNSLTTSLDKNSKTATTFGQKMKTFGSNFGVLSASVGSLGGSLVGLTRQYQDLGDTQIAVEKAQRKVSTAHEAVAKAQQNLTKVTAAFGANSSKAKQAALDLTQAESGLSIATQLLTERQEDHQRAQENFWIGLVPTITSAGGTIMGVMQNIGGGKGLGGITESLKGITSSAGSATGAIKGLGAALIGVAGGLGGAILILDTAAKAQAILDKMSSTDVSKRESPLKMLIEPNQQAIEQYKGQIAEWDALSKEGLTGFQLLSDAVLGTHFAENLAKSNKMLDESGKLLPAIATGGKEAAVSPLSTAAEYGASERTSTLR